MTTTEYACHYLTAPGRIARRIYHAPDLAEAMAMHRDAMPEYGDKVTGWYGPEGRIGAPTIPPLPLTIYTFTPEGTVTTSALDTDRFSLPEGHKSASRHFIAPDGAGVSARWATLDDRVVSVHVSADLFGLYHFDTLSHDPDTCEDCPSLKTWV